MRGGWSREQGAGLREQGAAGSCTTRCVRGVAGRSARVRFRGACIIRDANAWLSPPGSAGRGVRKRVCGRRPLRSAQTSSGRRPLRSAQTSSGRRPLRSAQGAALRAQGVRRGLHDSMRARGCGTICKRVIPRRLHHSRSERVAQPAGLCPARRTKASVRPKAATERSNQFRPEAATERSNQFRSNQFRSNQPDSRRARSRCSSHWW